jgi:hypothetical protein
MQHIDDEFPRLRKLKEARLARLQRQKTKQHHTSSPSSPPSSPQLLTTKISIQNKSPTSISFDINNTSNETSKTFNTICLNVSQLDRSIQDLLTRGTYLAEQTILDAETHYRKAYGLNSLNNIQLPIDNTLTTTSTNLLRIEPIEPIESKQTETSTTTTTTKTTPIPSILDIKYRSVLLTELQTKRNTKLLKNHLQHWKQSYHARLLLRKRLPKVENQTLTRNKMTEIELEHLWSNVHQTIGMNSFHPEEIFRKEGKHRMAKEYQKHRRLRKVFGRWMIQTALF